MRGRRQWIVLILFVLLLLEGTLVPWLIPSGWSTRIAPHFVLVTVLFAGVYMNRYYGLFLGLLFGMLHDVIYYGHMIGVYSFGTGLLGYLAGLAFQKKPANMVLMMLVTAVGLYAFDSLVFTIYWITKVIQITYEWALLHYILPSLFVNQLFALAVYVPIRKLLERKKVAKTE
jgi:rod shape-determining protein MreD